MSRKILAIDIQQDAVSAVLIKAGLKGNWVESFGHAPLDPSQDDFASALKSALSVIFNHVDPEGADCVVSFSCQWISFRNMRVPFTDRKKIQQILPFELEPDVPFPMENLVIDFHPIKLPDQSDQTRIIAGTMDRDLMGSALQVLSEYHLNPYIVAPSGFYTAIYLAKFMDSPEYCVFIDVVSSRCNLFFIVSGEICLIRHFLIPSDPQTRPDQLCMEIQRALTGFGELTGIDFQPDEIHVTGYMARDIGFEQVVKKRLGLSVRRVELFEESGVLFRDQRVTETESQRLHNALILGLSALKGVDGMNFRKGPFAIRNRFAENKSAIIGSGVLALVFFMVLAVYAYMDVFAAEKRVAELDAEIETIFRSVFPESTPMVDPLHQMETRLAELKKASANPGEARRSAQVIDILYEISSRIPDTIDVELTRLTIARDHALINGHTTTNNNVADMQSQLDASEIFQKVTIISTNKRKNGRIQFKLRADL